MAIGTKACEWSYGFMFPAGGDADFAVHEGGLEIPRTFSDPDVHPFDQLQWSTSPVIVRDGVTGAEVFRDEFEAPDTWSPTARQIVCTKFAYGKPGTPGRETSARQVIGRVAIRIARWGWKQGYFRQRDDVATFSDELTYLLINQYFSFNSPVWFNVGHDLIPSRVAPEADNWRNVDGTRPGGEYRVWSTCRNENIHKHPQVHACFIQGVDDSISGIMDLAKSEAIIFKYGSGTGTDLSTLRSTGETLTGGGTPSGPISFMRIYDAVAGTIKSGGKCLAPDQPVFTAGGVRTAKQLSDAGRDFTVLSWSNRLGRFAAKVARAWQSGRKPVVAVVTDKGEFHVSEDHPLMLRTGEAVRAIDLKAGMSLMPCNTGRTCGGYVRVRVGQGRDARRELLHRLVASDVCGWAIEGKVIHHGDRGKLDSEPDNLTLMEGQAEHALLHGRELAASGRHVFQRRRFNQVGVANGMHADSAFWKDADRADAYRDKQGAILRERGDAATMQESSRKVRMLNLGYVLINAGHDIGTFEGYVAARKAVGRRCPSVPGQLGKFEREFGSYAEFYRQLREGNHRVVEVRKIGTMDVYSVEVDDDEPDDKRRWSEHNYALAPMGESSPFMAGCISLNSRRAAKMQTLKCWHPDILDFVRCKSAEEKKARALIAAGYPSDFNGDAYSTVAFQNCNMSVRLTDEFMESATADVPPTRNIVSRLFPLRAVKTGEIVGHVDADELLTEIAKGSHFCGDPAVQFEDRFQEWHTTPNAGPINSTNPCLSGQTLVDTVEGPVCVADLARRHAAGESIPMVFCWDRETDIPAIRPVVRAFKTKDTDRMVDVVTRKGLTFRVTPDHPFLLHDGRYVAASDLKVGARLRKIGRWANEKRRGDRYINHRETPSAPNGTVRQCRWMWEQVHGPIPDGFDVHHRDEDSTNDRLSNMELKRSGVHQSEHSSGRSNPRFIDADESLLVQVWDAVADTGDVTVSRWNAEVRRSGLLGKVPIARYREGVGLIRGMSWYEFTAEVEAIRDRVNDRVESVTPVVMDRTIPVYDITVMGTANFAAFGHDRKGDHLHSIILKNCGEYASIDESGCNLASHRLTKFEAEDGTFDVDRYCAAIDLAIISQDIIIDPASYPTAKIAENVRRHRQLGLGYADLGALLMSRGLPYDSDEGRHLCSAITSLMTARAYRMSAALAKHRGAFDAYAADEANMMRVIRRHESASLESGIDPDSEAGSIMGRACGEWGAAIDLGKVHGFRNSQASLLAPTGTIGYMMDCDTLGIEPDTALVKHKHLAGGGDMVIVNRAVGRALDRLGYHPLTRDEIVDYVERHGKIHPDDVPCPGHMEVFDCAIPTVKGGRSIAPMGHVKMMAAAQPFVSGAISKTVNLPESSTVDDIKQIYVDAWKMGLKSITVYRDGSKYSQPVATSAPVAGRNGSLAEGGTPMDSGWSVTGGMNGEARSIPFIDVQEIDVPPDREPIRRRLPDRRHAVVHHFEIAGAHGNFDGYITVGLYDDGRPGEIFMASGKGGSTLDGMMKVIGTMTSMLLQYGVPIEVLSRKFSGIGFEPAGPTRSGEIRVAKSIIDYVFKWVAINFSEELKLEWTPAGHAPTIATATTGHVCGECGSANLIIEGRCWRCTQCFWVSGGCGG